MKEIAIQEKYIDGLTVIGGGNVSVDIFRDKEKSDEFLKNIKDFVFSIDRDISTVSGRENIKSVAYKIACMKKPLENAGKSLVEEQKKAVKQIDSSRISLVEAIEEIQKEFRKPLTDFENKEKERVQAHENNISMIKACGFFSFIPAIQEIESRINQLNEFNQKEFEEFKDRAKIAFEETNSILNKMLNDEKKKEEERIELERLRKEKEENERKAREEQIRIEAENKAKREAEEKARIEAERVEQEKIEAQKKAEAEKREIERKAKEEVEKIEREKQAEIEKANRGKEEAEEREKKAEQEKQKAIEDERKRVAEEKAREEQAKAKREANENHKRKINNEILKALMESPILLNEAQAKAIITLIANGKMPHTTINY